MNISSRASEITTLPDTEVDADEVMDAVTPIKILYELNVYRKFLLKIFGKVWVGDHAMLGWREALPFYVFNCSAHGLQVSYPTGWKRVLRCAECLS